ncbi:head maturation protease, ClpP-related [Enterovirga rhinocerotis]|nr:head maturation protease, ClpP-related [Enterovirga rhinocerotis]
MRLPRVMAAARPGAIALPSRRDVAAYSNPAVLDRWNAGIRAAASGENVITIYDVIGEDYWSGGGVTVNRIDAALRRIGDQAVEVHINSPGGDMFEGIAIFNRLLQHPAPVGVKVMGLAASAASIIAMAGNTIAMGPASFLMIHNCWVIAAGDRNDMAETAAYLAPFDDAMAALYAGRSGADKTTVAGWMDAETFMSAEQAIENGFADSLLTADEMEVDEGAREQASAHNAVRKAELGLCRSMSRSEARSLLSKIKGTPGAAPDAGGGAPKTATPGAGDLSWLGAAADLTRALGA